MLNFLKSLTKPKGYYRNLEISKRSFNMEVLSFENNRKDHKYDRDDFFSYSILYRLSNIDYRQVYIKRVLTEYSLVILNKESFKIHNLLSLKYQNGVQYEISICLHKNEMYQKIQGDLLDIEINLIKGSYEYKLNSVVIDSMNEFNNKYNIYSHKNRYEVTYEIFHIVMEMWTNRINEGSLSIKEIHDEFQKINRKKVVQILLKQKRL